MTIDNMPCDDRAGISLKIYDLNKIQKNEEAKHKKEQKVQETGTECDELREIPFRISEITST